jgi:hypothetical protein
MTQIPFPIKLEIIPGSRGRFNRLYENWPFYSDVLGCWSMAPAGFVWDLESILSYKGENPMAGTGHDLVCRSDFFPKIDKITAAMVYAELAAFEDAQSEKQENETGLWKLWQIFHDFITRRVKRNVVIVAPGYFQKHKIMATYEEMAGL